jgi:hypothetical protein
MCLPSSYAMIRLFLGHLLLCILCVAQSAKETSVHLTESERMNTTPGTVTPRLAAQILMNEKAVWEAAKQKNVHQFDRLVADDARMIFTSGVETKSEYIKSFTNRKITSYFLQDFQFFMPAAKTVITIYKATVSGRFNGKELPPFTLREASVWVKRGGRWVAVLNQETPIHAHDE